MQAYIVLRRTGTLWQSIHKGDANPGEDPGNRHVPFVLVSDGQYEGLTESEMLTDLCHRAYGNADGMWKQSLAEYAPYDHLIVPLHEGASRILRYVQPPPPPAVWNIEIFAEEPG